MATRSTIALVKNDGTVNQIYCHWDGDLAGVGLTLEQFYASNYDKMVKLMKFGDIAELGEYLENTRLIECGEKAKAFGSLDNFMAYRDIQEFNYVVKDNRLYTVINDNLVTFDDSIALELA